MSDGTDGLVIKDGVIVEAEYDALHRFWLTRWSDYYSWEDYLMTVKKNGMIVKGGEE